VAQLLERVTLPDFRCWHFWDMPTVLKMSASGGRPEVIACRQNDEIDPQRTFRSSDVWLYRRVGISCRESNHRPQS
jgi:hypothetical protein